VKASLKESLVLNLDGAARQREAVWVEVTTQADHLSHRCMGLRRTLVQHSSDARNDCSDHWQFMQARFPAVGISIGTMSLHPPADTVEQVQPDVLSLAASLLLAIIWRLA
jgi:hypothetical protein